MCAIVLRSRNARLSHSDRQAALSISQGLQVTFCLLGNLQTWQQLGPTLTHLMSGTCGCSGLARKSGKASNLPSSCDAASQSEYRRQEGESTMSRCVFPQSNAMSRCSASLHARLPRQRHVCWALQVVHASTLEAVENVTAQPSVLAVAAHFGNVRLIDNLELRKA